MGADALLNVKQPANTRARDLLKKEQPHFWCENGLLLKYQYNFTIRIRRILTFVENSTLLGVRLRK